MLSIRKHAWEFAWRLRQLGWGSALGIGLALTTAVGAAHADKVDDYVADQMQRQHIPGVAIAVIKGGKPVKVAGYGSSNLELQTRVTPQSVFKIGSLSKPFIASGIVLLAGEGKLGLDDPIKKYFPDAPPIWQPITVRQILSHSAGLPREGPGFDPLKVKSDLEVIRSAYSLPLLYEPGNGWDYSNLGYFILADIIRQVAQKPWEDYMRERVFAPAGMTATRATTNADLIPQRVDGYDWSGSGYNNADDVIAVRPSGAFISSVQDLVKWEAALRANKVLSNEQQQAMRTPVKLLDGSTRPYGLGWQVETIGDHGHVFHGGTMPGFRSEMARFVDDDLTVIVLTNASGAGPRRIAIGLADMFIPNLLPNRTTVKVSPTVIDGYIGKYQLSGGRILHVARSGSDLSLTVSVGPTTFDIGVLKAESETRFFIADDRRTTYVFGKDAQGRLQLVSENQEGKVIQTAPRLD